MSTGEGRKVSPEDIQMVQNLIEQCLAHYMNQKQVIDILYQQQNIEPSFTELVWQKLEEQNQEFFETYYLRLLVKEQITKFNNLLGRQAALLNQVNPHGLSSQPVSNGSHTPAIHNAAFYKSENTGPHPVETFVPSGLNNCGPSIHLESDMQRVLDMSAHSRRIDVPSNMLLAQNSNVGTMQGMNGLAIKTGPDYLGNPKFVYQVRGGVLEAHPAINNPPVSSFGSMDSVSHQLNGTLVDDTCSFELLRPIAHDIGLPESIADFTNSTDTVKFSKSPFPLPYRVDFLDSHGSTIEHQGENKRLADISTNLGFQNFGRDS